MDIPFGKRIVSSKPETLFYRFPQSDQEKTLPAGRPSPPVDSFIQGRYYQFIVDGENVYLEKDKSNQEVVETGAPDRSIPGADLFYGVSDWLGNVTRNVEKGAGFVGEGFRNSLGDVSLGFTGLGKDLQKALVAGAFFSVIGLAVYLFLKLK